MLRQFVHSLRAPAWSWVEEGRLIAGRYPREDAVLAEWRGLGIGTVVNLREDAHAPGRLERLGLREVHVPMRDLRTPSEAQLTAGVEGMLEAFARGEGVAVHCAAGLGRTGTLVACYFVATGLTAEEAIARVRAARPGTIETRGQEDAVRRFAQRRG
ncbi:MAG: dual specificity protein phosphatase family protein [Dehalococcoidia bacterium]